MRAQAEEIANILIQKGFPKENFSLDGTMKDWILFKHEVKACIRDTPSKLYLNVLTGVVYNTLRKPEGFESPRKQNPRNSYFERYKAHDNLYGPFGLY